MNAKKTVVDFLIGKNNLTFKEIFEQLKKEGCTYSYHTLYKAVRSLEEDSVLIKDKSSFHLNSSWVKTKLNFAEKLKTHSDNLFFEYKEFTNLESLYTFLRSFESDQGVLESSDDVFWIANHLYTFLFSPAMELTYLKNLIHKTKRLFVLCRGSSKLDYWTKKSFEEIGVNFLENSNLGGFSDMNLYSDCMIRITYDNCFTKYLEEFYNKFDDICNVNIGELLDGLDKMDYRIYVSVCTKKEIVDSHRKKALSNFQV